MFALFVNLASIMTNIAAMLALITAFKYFGKFIQMQNFILNSNHLMTWHYTGDRMTMRNIVLRGSKPFCLLVGVKMDNIFIEQNQTVFDWFGFVQSDENGVAVISTHLGKDNELQFFVNTDLETNPIIITSSDDDQTLEANATYPPHWYQRLGFFG